MMEMSKMEKCGTCVFCKKINGEWTCDNPDSDNYGLEVEFKDVCEDYEERE